MATRKTPSSIKKDASGLDAAYFLRAAISLVVVLIGAYNGLDTWWSRDALDQQRHINDRQALANAAVESRLSAIERELAARSYQLKMIEKYMDDRDKPVHR